MPLIVLGGGIGLSGGIMLEPIREQLDRLVPYPPRVEISQLGDAAILIGAITVAARNSWPQIVSARLATVTFASREG